MRYLITGGAGFIGSHLSESLLAAGDHVDIIDDLSTGCIQNVRHLKENPRFTYAIDTIMNRGVLAELVDGCDIVVHLAAAVGVRLIVENPVRTIETNIRGTELVLDCAAKKGRKVLLASTSEVYGKSEAVPFREDGDLLLGSTDKARWSYACSKAIDEFLALAYWKEKGLPTVILRLFNTVGPRQTGRYGMVLPTFVRQALQGRTIGVFGDGRQTRCFAHVRDAVRAIAALAQEPKAVGRIFNIGSVEEIEIRELARLVKEETRSASEIVHIPYDQAYEAGFEDMRRRVPDISRLRGLIGYEPTYSIRDIVRDVVAHHREPSLS